MAAETAFDPDGGTVARRYWDPVTGEAVHRTGPNSRVKCGRVRWQSVVGFVRYGGPDSAVTVTGCTRCGNMHACPSCMQAKLRAAGEQLKHTVSNWHDDGPDRVYLVTLTAAHNARTDEGDLRDAVQGAWREIWQGREAQAWKDATGLAGWCRRLEVTYGPNGAHPHQHVVLAFREAKDDAARGEIMRWVLWRWAEALDRRGFTCDAGHGANIVPADREGQYLVKMGLGLALEMTATDAKVAADGHTTPLAALARYAETGHADAGRLWQRHCRVWRGRRSLEWSRGRLAWRNGAPRQGELSGTDTTPVVVATMPGDTWDAIACADRWEAKLSAIESIEAERSPQTFDDWRTQTLKPLQTQPPTRDRQTPPDVPT